MRKEEKKERGREGENRDFIGEREREMYIMCEGEGENKSFANHIVFVLYSIVFMLSTAYY